MRQLFINITFLIIVLSFSNAAFAFIEAQPAPYIDARAFSNLSSAVSSPSTYGLKILITSPQTVNTLTIPDDRTIEVLKGGSINVSKDSQLIINGTFQAGLYQVFSGVGNVSFGMNSILEVYPQWFGAKGDGVTDDTPAVQMAVNSWSKIYFPPAYYKVKSVAIPSARTLHGEYARSIIFSSDNYSSVFKVTGSEVTIEDLRFSNYSNEARSGGVFIDTTNSIITIRHCYFTKGFIGVRTSSTLFTMTDCDMRDFGAGGTIIQINDGFNVYLDRIRSDHVAPYPRHGIHISSTGDTTITNSNIIHCGTGLYISPPKGKVVASVYASNTFFDTADAGIDINTIGGGSVVRCHFVNCWSSSHKSFGTSINSENGYIDGISFINLQSNLNAGDGVRLLGSNTKNIYILGGEMAENGGSGIYAGKGVTDFHLNNLLIGAIHGLTGNGHGIFIDSDCSSYEIKDCNIRGNTKVDYYDASKNGIIINNKGVATHNGGNDFIPEGASSIVVYHGLISTPRPHEIIISPTSWHGANHPYVDTSSINEKTFTIRTVSPSAVKSHFSWTANCLTQN